MGNYQMSCNYRRPNNCMNNPSCEYKKYHDNRQSPQNTVSSMVKENKNFMENSNSCLADMPLAMAYVPMQTFCSTFDLCSALKTGTIFPELCKPFCGKRGIMR